MFVACAFRSWLAMSREMEVIPWKSRSQSTGKRLAAFSQGIVLKSNEITSPRWLTLSERGSAHTVNRTVDAFATTTATTPPLDKNQMEAKSRCKVEYTTTGMNKKECSRCTAPLQSTVRSAILEYHLTGSRPKVRRSRKA